MHTRLTLIIPALFSGLIFLSSSAKADATLNFSQTDFVNNTSNTNQMLIHAQRIRFLPFDGNEAAYHIFDSAANRLFMVRDEEKKYMMIDEQKVNRIADMMASQMNSFKAQIEMMRTQLNTMPPEQLQQAQAMISYYDQMVQESQNPPQRIQSGRQELVAGVRCDVFETLQNNIKSREQCVVGPESLGLNQSDLNTLLAMKQFMLKMQDATESMMQKADFQVNNLESLNGFPVLTRFFDENGKTLFETRLISITNQPVAADVVTIPLGYTEQPMQGIQQ